MANKDGVKRTYNIRIESKFVHPVQGQQVMDIDVLKTDMVTRSNFLSEKNQYEGHHPLLVDPVNRTFRVFLKIKGTYYFEGEVFFNVQHVMNLQAGFFRSKGGDVTLSSS